MSKIIITIEDDPIRGTVKMVSNPPFSEMAMKISSGHPSTAAEGYALRMLREARAISHDLDSKIKIKLPRLGKA